ncbi:MAG: hypothetical protein QOF78_3311 [Phycisphaerales bacterium]|jgi:uncharacterized membrane protein YgcG|nr:hypothetical protein [Phycisphaerales bacterium]
MTLSALSAVSLCLVACAFASAAEPATRPLSDYVLDYDTKLDPSLQSKLESIDTALREQFSMTTEQTAVGVLDLKT